MELTYLRTFLEVAKWGSFTRAAEVLGYAQSSITTQIQKLEETYGVVLLERYGRKMKLTIAGEALLPYANGIIKLSSESKELVSKQSKGTLSIGTIETLAAFFLPPYLQIYRQTYPDMRVIIQPANEPEIIDSVLVGSLDLGVILDPLYTHPELHSVVLREEELVIVIPANHRLSGRNQVTVQDLENESLILTEDGCSYRAMLLQALHNSQIKYRLSYEFGNQEAIKQCVSYELGVALLPRVVVADEIHKGLIKAIPFIHPDVRFYTQLIYSKKKWQSKAFLAFLELISSVNHRNE